MSLQEAFLRAAASDERRKAKHVVNILVLTSALIFASCLEVYAITQDNRLDTTLRMWILVVLVDIFFAAVIGLYFVLVTGS